MSNVQYILGYDASCGVCSATTKRMNDEVGTSLTFQPLQSALMRQYRTQALGSDAVWAPTLVKIEDGSVEAWIGWKMGPELMKATGPYKALQLLSILGQEAALPPQRGVSRRSMLRSIAGVAAGAMVLSGVSGPAFANVNSAKPGTPLTEAEARKVFLEFMQQPDAKNAFSDSYDLTQLRDDLLQGDKRFTVGGTRTKNSRSTTTSAAVMDNEMDVVLWCSTRFDQNTKSTAAAIYAQAEENALRIVSPSINGQLAQDAALAPESAIRGMAAGSDPCGGCKSIAPGSRDQRSLLMCHDKLNLACALGLAGCAGCAATCAGGANPGCLFCLVTSCGGVLASGGCCDDKKPPYTTCVRCSAI